METVNKASNKAHEVVDMANQATHEMAEKIVNKGDELNDLAHESIDKAAQVSNQAAERIAEKSDQLINAEQRIMKECTVYIRENPITSIGIAFGVGYILSRLFNDR